MRTLIFLPLFLLLACSPNVQTRGYLREPDWKEQITIGQTTHDELLQRLGSPSAQSSFGPDVWYYISTRRESFAFFKPEVTDEEVTRISFNEDGTVAAIDQFTKEQARDIVISSRETPTAGHHMSFMEQLFGNMGRFNAPGSTVPNGGRLPGQGR